MKLAVVLIDTGAKKEERWERRKVRKKERGYKVDIVAASTY